MMYVAEAGI